MAEQGSTRRAILETAARLFHENSYADVGVERICREAGVSKGSFFHFFPAKRDLAAAAVDWFRERYLERLVADAFAPARPPLDRLARFVDGLYDMQQGLQTKHGRVLGCPFGNLVMEQGAREEALRLKIDGVLGALRNHVRAAVSDAVQRGELPVVDEEATAEAMIGYLEGIQLMAKARNDPELIRRLGPAVTRIRIPPG